jgi:WhiB family transcriptional regulator, redox-sensing transcriptional regulator
MPFNGTQLCAQTDPEIFFPVQNFRRKDDIALAISICNRCPVLEECREYAESLTGIFGVWGGKMYDGSNYVSPIKLGSPRKAA